MSLKTEIVTAVGTISCAIAIGFVMQSGEVAELRYGARAAIPAVAATPLVGQPVAPPSAGLREDTPLSVEAITLTSAQIHQPVILYDPGFLIKAALDHSTFELPRTADSDHASGADDLSDCFITASAAAQAAAMVAFSLEAPCHAGVPVVVQHDDLMFSTVLSDTGTLDENIPALSQNARIFVTFKTGETAHAFTKIESLPLYDRFVLQWRGATGIQLHAREFGAGYGDQGHIWSGERRDLTALDSGHGGHLETLGDASLEGAHLAEIYTFPSSKTKMTGAVTLTVETEVTAENCAEDVRAQTLQFVAGRRMSTREVTLSMPSCDAIGSFLVLNNLIEDLTVARR